MVKGLSEKLKALQGVCAAIEKQFGKGAVMKLGEEAIEQKISVIPSGSVGLDRAFGVGGYPRGRVVEIFGQESSGKTTLTLHAIAQAQAHGGVAAFIDAEHALDVSYARKLGVRAEELLVSQPDTGEQALEIGRGGTLKDGGVVIGSGAKVRVVKNKVAPPFQEAEFDILYGSGISRAGEVVDLGVSLGLIEKSASHHFSHRGERIGHGRERAVDYLREHPALLEELAAQVVAIRPPVRGE